jgi:hypothetical protein
VVVAVVLLAQAVQAALVVVVMVDNLLSPLLEQLTLEAVVVVTTM